MDQVHQIIQDVEDLKYNDAQFQMNNELQNRDAQTKKGIYSDDFSSDAQSDIHHDDWSARIDPVRQFVGLGRAANANMLEVDRAASRALFKGSLVLLPGAEKVLIEQNDWSEDKNINPYAVFEKPEAGVEITPNIGRRGQTGIAVTGSNFTPNAAGVTVRCDGRVCLKRRRRRGRTGERLLRGADEHPQRQPHRRGDRRHLFRADEPAGQQPAGDHAHPAHRRQPHHRPAPDHRAPDSAPHRPHSGRAHRLALAVALAPPRSPSPSRSVASPPGCRTK